MMRIKEYMRNIFKNKLFLNMIFPYTCVLLVPTVIWLISNIYAMKTNEESVASLITENIVKSVAVVDSNLTQVENMVMQISQNRAFDSFYSDQNISYAEKMKLQSILASYRLENGISQNVYMYSRTSGIVIDKDAVYFSPYDFYRYKCGFDEKTSKDWAKRTDTVSHLNGYDFETVFINEKNLRTQVLPYLRIFPMEYPSKKQGVIGVLIDEKELLNSFNAITVKYDSEMYVYNRNGELIMSRGNLLTESIYEDSYKNSHKHITVNGKQLRKFTYTSPKNQWRYNVFITEKDLSKNVVVVNTVLGTINFITFILGLLVCIWLTYGRHKSYIKILDILGKKNESLHFKRTKNNEFEFLRPYIDSVLSESEATKKEIEKLSETEGQKAIRLLLLSKNISEENAIKLCKDYKMEFSGEKFVVMVIESSVAYNINEVNNKAAFLTQVIKTYISDDFYLYISNSKTTVAVINYDMDTAEFYIQLREKIAKMNMNVFYRLQTDIHIGVGETVNKLSEISASYAQALNVIDYGRLVDFKNNLFYSDIPIEQTMYYYPLELEQKFMYEISAGRTEEALETANIIYDENFIQRRLSANRIKELFSEILSTLDKFRQIYFENELETDYNRFDFTVKSFFEYLNEFIILACENAETFDEKAQKSRFHKIIEFIKENYNDANISLSSVAKNFGFKDITHVSKGVKKHTGENFSSYLEKIRIEKACEMLKQNISVNETSQKVGYLSDVSFRRAFKRKMGVSPLEYAQRINDK